MAVVVEFENSALTHNTFLGKDLGLALDQVNIF